MAERPPPPSLSQAPLAPGLYLVATPIGNLRDITLRALDVLNACDVVLAEDTRVTSKLLSAYGLSKKMYRYDEHSAAQAGPRVLALLADGARVAQCSDAGTPMVSDPGSRLAIAAIAAGHAVFPIPGASAPLAALTLAGLPTERFMFVGFAPPKSAARRTFLNEFNNLRSTLIFFESGPRLAASLADMAAVLGDREAAVCRELTKLHETCVRGRLSVLAADPKLNDPKGEIVVVVAPGEAEVATEADADAAIAEALTRLPPGEAASEVAKALGVNRRELYRKALAMKDPPRVQDT